MLVPGSPTRSIFMSPRKVAPDANFNAFPPKSYKNGNQFNVSHLTKKGFIYLNILLVNNKRTKYCITWQSRPFLTSSSSQIFGAKDLVSLSYMSGFLDSSFNFSTYIIRQGSLTNSSKGKHCHPMENNKTDIPSVHQM